MTRNLTNEQTEKWIYISEEPRLEELSLKKKPASKIQQRNTSEKGEGDFILQQDLALASMISR